MVTLSLNPRSCWEIGWGLGASRYSTHSRPYMQQNENVTDFPNIVVLFVFTLIRYEIFVSAKKNLCISATCPLLTRSFVSEPVMN
jgi:hypothetical protein